MEVIFPAFCTYNKDKFDLMIFINNIKEETQLNKSFHDPSKNELVIGPKKRTLVKITGTEMANNKPFHLNPNKVRRSIDS